MFLLELGDVNQLSYKIFGKTKTYLNITATTTKIKNKKWYIHNIFTIFIQQILSGKLLLVVIVRAKK